MLRYYFILATAILSLSAKDMVFAKGAQVCVTFDSPQAILECVRVNDPRVKQAEAGVQEAAGEVEKAGQIPNLEFESDIGYTNNFGSDRYSTESRLLHTFELGGKRSARVNTAKALERREKLRESIQSGSVAVETVLLLHRYRQILEELDSVNEILQTFSKIQKVYRGKTSLSPEHRVSLDVFELAESDQKLIESKLKLELSHLKRDLALSIGRDIELTDTVLPKSPKEWPSIEPVSGRLDDSPITKISKENLGIATGEFEVAKSGAWPDLSIGPSVASDFENGDRVYSYGISLSLPLPLYHQNNGEKAIASARLRRAKIQTETEVSRIRKERDRLSETYTNMVENLKSMRSHSSLHSKHKKIHTYIRRGIISSALVIESHRQLLDFLQHRNEIELRAIESLWKIYLTDGTILKQSL